MFYPRILEHKGCALEVHISAQLLAMDPFFPEFSCGVTSLFESRTVRADPKDFVLFHELDFDFGGSVPWNTQP